MSEKKCLMPRSWSTGGVLHWILFVIVLDQVAISYSDTEVTEVEIKVDPAGYIAFCPCMGRFGNQADQFLGALAFAKSINRTFIIPHWVEYVPFETGSRQIPYSTYFDPEAIHSFHKSIDMETFMNKLAPTIWPPEKRIAFCYMERGPGAGCNAKEGNPFGPYWDKFGVDFVKSEIYGPHLHHVTDDVGHQNWIKKYPGDIWPVLAFVGAPSSFPVQEKNIYLQQYMVWNKQLAKKAADFVKALPEGPFIGIHLRNGLDWAKACELVDGKRDLFASTQCTGYDKHNKILKLTYEMCSPSDQTVLKQLKSAVQTTRVRSVFVASDRNHMIDEIHNSFKRLDIVVKVFSLKERSPHLDLAILARSTLFIGNCVSSFSAFVIRERNLKGLPSEFWASPVKYRHKPSSTMKTEL